MKAVTLHQPNPSLIAVGAKWIITRRNPTDHRGPIAIHASRQRSGILRPRVAEQLGSPMTRSRELHPGTTTFDGPDLPMGAAVAIADLYDVIPIVAHDEDWTIDHCIEVGPTGSDMLTLWTPAGSAPGDVPDERDVSDQYQWADRETGRYHDAWSGGGYAWLLTDVRPVEPAVDVGGRGGVWNLPADVAAAVDANAAPLVDALVGT